jgi:glycosyltransferase involved in cell wall biosynthesis
MNENLIWIGSGDEDLTDALEASGIRVISWMKQGDIWNPKMNIGATCIASSWESGPLTLFESLRAGRPVICRSIEAIDLYGFPTYDTTIGFARALNMVNQSSDFRSQLFESQVSLIVKKFEDLTKTYSFSDHYIPHGNRNA